MSSKDSSRQVVVPVSLLTAEGLSPTAKVLWMVLSLDQQIKLEQRHSPSRLSRITGYARETVRNGLRALTDSVWYSRISTKHERPVDRQVTIPSDVIFDTSLAPQAKLLYGVLKALPFIEKQLRQFKYAALSRHLHLDVKTIKKSIRQLVNSGWLTLNQIHRMAPLFYSLKNPIVEFAKRIESQISRLFKFCSAGEALMKGFLTAVVDSNEFIDNARPGYLENPETGYPLELDRYYHLAGVAFEFNGSQHYYATEKYNEMEVVSQRKRDDVKTKLCSDRNIRLITIQGKDLSLSAIIEKVKGFLPLRSLRGLDDVLYDLEMRSAQYQARLLAYE